MGGPDRYPLLAPDGRPAEVPVAVDPARDPYPTLAQPDGARAYFAEQGYVVLRGLVPAALGAAVLEAFRAEVKPDRAFLLERPGLTVAQPLITESGFVREPVRDFHRETPRRFPGFHRAALALLPHPDLHRAARLLLGEEDVVVETHVYEGNPVTRAHQDGWYFDSLPRGRVIGCWIALEEIHPGAGRFFVYPGSHKLDMQGYGVAFDVSKSVDPYARLVLDVVGKENLVCRAPAMNPGDVLFWTGNTIHGTLETREPGRSRGSMNLHLIPASCRYVRYGSHPVPLRLRTIDGVKVHF